MYAVVRIGGRQYPVEAGQYVLVEKLPNEVGDKLTLDEVLMVGDGDKSQVGQPTLDGASVTAEVVAQEKGKKVVVFKYKSRTGYRRKQGHRQQYSRLKIDKISAGSKKKAKKAEDAEQAEQA